MCCGVCTVTFTPQLIWFQSTSQPTLWLLLHGTLALRSELREVSGHFCFVGPFWYFKPPLSQWLWHCMLSRNVCFYWLNFNVRLQGATFTPYLEKACSWYIDRDGEMKWGEGSLCNDECLAVCPILILRSRWWQKGETESFCFHWQVLIQLSSNCICLLHIYRYDPGDNEFKWRYGWPISCIGKTL